MAVTVVVGGQWGDEGKGKIIDVLSDRAQVVARYQGGSNAGHTVINPFGTFALHLVPSGIFNPNAKCIVGTGMAVNPAEMICEIQDLNQRGISTDNLFISDRAHVVASYHKQQDRLLEMARGATAVGTTMRGIGPAYSDKYGYNGIRMGDLLDETTLRDKVAYNCKIKDLLFRSIDSSDELSEDQVFEELRDGGRCLAPFITDTFELIHRELEAGSKILAEGAQGTLLDVDLGSYQYVTSSSTTAGGACTGLGIPPSEIEHTLGAFKAYQTRVGAGPFPSELEGKEHDQLRGWGNEFGTTTGRPRRCGWFDAVLARYCVRINGLTSLAITKLDVLDELPAIKVCVAYDIDGHRSQTVPASPRELARVKPIYEELPGWESSTCEVREYEGLPSAARSYVDRLAELTGRPVAMISVGGSRERVITLKDPMNWN